MNKKVIIAVGILVLLILGIGGYMLFANKTTSSSNAPAGQTSQETEKVDEISSIQDALAKSMTLKCDYSTSEGTKVVAYVKNGMVRSDVTGASAQQSGSVIMRDNKIYFWNSQGGYIMAMPDLSVTPSAGQNSMTGMDNSVAAMEQYKSYCKKASNVDDALFVLPTGVKFEDSSAMQKQMMQQAPSGMSGSEQKQYEELMKKYSNPQ